MYYGRQEGYKNFGLQQLPALQVSEYNAKLAISIGLLLKSLATSKFAQEKWTFPETSAELILTPPKNCLKKSGYTVEVMYDNDPDNISVHTNWDHIYYQDLEERWHKVPGKVDHNGMYYDDVLGERVYFYVFAPDADRLSKTGTWTVKYKSTTISSVVTSSSKQSSRGYSARDSATSSRCSSPEEGPSTRRPKTSSQESSRCSPTTSSLGNRRRRKQQGEPESQRDTGGKRKRPIPLGVSAAAVGSRHQSLPREGLSRLERLTEEARDPPIIVIKGPANNLKCWRFRCNNRYGHLFSSISTVFRWVEDCNNKHEALFGSRMLVAFKDNLQRQTFLSTVHLPRGTSFAYGHLDSL